MRPGWVLVCISLLGCSQIFGLEAPKRGEPGGPGPDGGTCTAASTECVGDTLRTCSEAGVVPIDTTCGWGCATTDSGPHCQTLVPQGGLVDAAALAPDPEVGTALLDGPVTIDTGTGEIAGIRDAGEGVINGIRFTSSTRNGGIFTFSSLVIEEVTVTVIGAQPLVIVALDGATIRGTLDLRGPCTMNLAGPGGSAGGAASMSGGGLGGGAGAGSQGKRAGSGAGHGTMGGAGGNGGAGGIALGGASYGDATITLLRGGSGGGGGGDTFVGAGGGGGGGAIQIAANSDITIEGVINAGGCGGKIATTISSGGGGGSGGTILLEAPNVTIAGVLAVNGGGGAGGGGGMSGENASASRAAALGGAAGTDSSAGGNGGAGNTAPQAGGASDKSGGGGGAVGRIRLNTRSGTATVTTNAVMSPAFTDNPAPATQGIAAVR